MSSPTEILSKAYASAISSPLGQCVAYFKDINKYIYSIDFQICFSTTLRDDSVGNPWAMYPMVKVCVGVPWYYSVGVLTVWVVGEFVL